MSRGHKNNPNVHSHSGHGADSIKSLSLPDIIETQIVLQKNRSFVNYKASPINYRVSIETKIGDIIYHSKANGRFDIVFSEREYFDVITHYMNVLMKSKPSTSMFEIYFIQGLIAFSPYNKYKYFNDYWLMLILSHFPALKKVVKKSPKYQSLMAILLYGLSTNGYKVDFLTDEFGDKTKEYYLALKQSFPIIEKRIEELKKRLQIGNKFYMLGVIKGSDNILYKLFAQYYLIKSFQTSIQNWNKTDFLNYIYLLLNSSLNVIGDNVIFELSNPDPTNAVYTHLQRLTSLIVDTPTNINQIKEYKKKLESEIYPQILALEKKYENNLHKFIDISNDPTYLSLHRQYYPATSEEYEMVKRYIEYLLSDSSVVPYELINWKESIEKIINFTDDNQLNTFILLLQTSNIQPRFSEYSLKRGDRKNDRK